MSIWQSIILGIIQGLTEFLPISSSAHLVITPYLFNWNIPAQDELIFDVLVQVGTLVAVVVYFIKDLISIARGWLGALWRRQPFASQESRMGWYLILATIPAGLAGLLLKDLVGAAFDSPLATALFLLLTAALLMIAEKAGKRTRSMEHLNWKDALVIGLFQVLALFPGVSRSGSTIAGGMLRDTDRPTAARFSFLMSVPVMLAAGAGAVYELLQIPGFATRIPTLAVGFITSAIVGYLSIRWLLAFLTRRPLYAFAIYCVCLCLLVVAVTLIR
ncbi:MAG: undecaprenyl-diphosphatase UppP [Anaerolineales bacterium]|nr:undecaprenyl-diphosphatase UppP [Anaerolineales bacterium]